MSTWFPLKLGFDSFRAEKYLAELKIVDPGVPTYYDPEDALVINYRIELNAEKHLTIARRLGAVVNCLSDPKVELKNLSELDRDHLLQAIRGYRSLASSLEQLEVLLEQRGVALNPLDQPETDPPSFWARL